MVTKAPAATLPTMTDLYELLVRLHGEVGQVQYPYSAKVLKWGIIRDSEIEEALKADPDASEQTAWADHKPGDVSLRLAGGLTAYVDQEGYREKWMDAGLAEGSWKTFLEAYCMLKPSATPFTDPGYFRDKEMDNLVSLVKILDEEIFSHPDMKGPTQLKASFKSKWWKECHRVFAEAAQESVYRQLGLPSRPKYGLCHTPEWTDALKNEIRGLAKRWRTAKLWDQKQGTDPGEVDFTSNNEATVKMYLDRTGFTTHYLEGR